jgi:glycosyltransferase involved in cell wall biosynthesis
MNIFFICNKSPYPQSEGGPIAMNQLIEGMADAGHQVKVLAINSNKYFINKKDIPESYRNKTRIELAYIDLSIKPLPAFLNLFSSKSYHVTRFIDKGFERKIIKILSENYFDIIQLETLFITPYIATIRKFSDARIVLRAHNIEHKIWERVRKSSRNPFKKWYLRHLIKTLQKYEIETLNLFDGIAAITPQDARFFMQFHQRVTDIPFGLTLSDVPPAKVKPEFPSLFHIGSMNWIPNEEGIRWFLEKVWPLVNRERPELPLYLAGRHMPAWLTTKKYPGVHVIGEVDSAFDFMASKGIMVVPLLSGSGIRIKIIEAMALSKPVISTTVGAEGIKVTDGHNISLADDANTFAEKIISLSDNPGKAEAMGREAGVLIKTMYDSQKIIKKLEQFYLTL